MGQNKCVKAKPGANWLVCAYVRRNATSHTVVTHGPYEHTQLDVCKIRDIHHLHVYTFYKTPPLRTSRILLNRVGSYMHETHGAT